MWTIAPSITIPLTTGASYRGSAIDVKHERKLDFNTCVSCHVLRLKQGNCDSRGQKSYQDHQPDCLTSNIET